MTLKKSILSNLGIAIAYFLAVYSLFYFLMPPVINPEAVLFAIAGIHLVYLFTRSIIFYKHHISAYLNSTVGFLSVLIILTLLIFIKSYFGILP
jgi:hypothetical protein